MDIEHFIWRNISRLFGIPQSITDNGQQFVGKDVAKFFQKYGIKQYMSTPRYPQGNMKAKHPTRSSLTASRNPSLIRKENGQTNSPDVYGHIAPSKDEQPVRLISLWHLAHKQSLIPMSSS
ncbi:hypothetical protein ACFX16_007793 [Malus domestica]